MAVELRRDRVGGPLVAAGDPDHVQIAFGRWVILSADSREVVAGIVSMGDASRAAWTTHPTFVMPITQQIQHDVSIAKVLTAHRDALEASFGPALARLRQRFRRSTGRPG